MPGKTPKNNGNEPIENRLRSNGDVDMKDSGKSKGKKGAKEGDEEMTVVVPITKTPKQSSKQSHDADGDVSMGGDDIADDSEKIDLVAQTVAGMFASLLNEISNPVQIALCTPNETTLGILDAQIGFVASTVLTCR